MTQSPWKQRPGYQRILFPIDGSRDAHVAILELVPLALASGAAVVVLEVTESQRQVLARASSAGWLPAGDGFLTEEDVRSSMEAQRRAAADHQRRVQFELEQAGVEHVELIVAEGHAGPVIVETAESTRCDAIVMATHGRSGLSRMLLGSVAEYVVRHSPCPLLLVPAAPHRRRPETSRAAAASR
ncbi:MAG: universal stress protein [Dehalococcoidia bacterium]|nr:universal stress protein [Dehalococcoidia bacterium]